MAPLSRLAPALLAVSNVTTNLSVTLLTPSTTGFLSISSGSLTCPNSTVSYTGDLLPLVVDYTYTPAYDPSETWNGTLPPKDNPQGSFDRNGTAEFALSSLKSGWVRFVVQDNTKAEAYSIPYQLKVGSKGVDGCTKPRISSAVKTALIWLGILVFPITALFLCIWLWVGLKACYNCCTRPRAPRIRRAPRNAPHPPVLHPAYQLPILVPPPPPPAPVLEVVQPPAVEEEQTREQEGYIVEAPREEGEDQPPAYGVDSKVPGGV